MTVPLEDQRQVFVWLLDAFDHQCIDLTKIGLSLAERGEWLTRFDTALPVVRDDRSPVLTLARALLLETVRAMATAGGLLSDEGVRESVRQARVFYDELETPTPRAARDESTPPTVRTVDDGSDGDTDTSGLADLLGA